MATVSASAIVSKKGRRQSVRRALILGSLLLLPVGLNYLSPYLVIESGSLGTVNGSLIAFALMFLSSLFVGRLWCGWACPGAGLQEACSAVNNGRVRGGWLDLIKWVIWIPWVAAIAYVAISAGGYHQINPLYSTERIVTLDDPSRYAIYYLVIGLLTGLPIAFGRRAACHYICWMAPFMIIGRKLADFFRWPALRLKVDSAKCTSCGRCAGNCPMSLNVTALVKQGAIASSECILCGTCVDNCPNKVIRYSFSTGK